MSTAAYATVAQNVDLGAGNNWTNPTNAQGAPNGSYATCAVPDDSATNGLRCKTFGLDRLNATALDKFIVKPKLGITSDTGGTLHMSIGDDSGNKIDDLLVGVIAPGSPAELEIDVYKRMASVVPVIPKSQLAALRTDQLSVTFFIGSNSGGGLNASVDSCYADITPVPGNQRGGGGGTAASGRAAASVALQSGAAPVEIVIPIRLVIQLVLGVDPESDGGSNPA